MRTKVNKITNLVIFMSSILFLAACSTNAASEKQIIRAAHNQSSNHPTHIGMLAFEEYIEERLGDKYDVELYPNELLGSQTNLVQLTQTGAVQLTVASNSILETFNSDFQLFNLPYLFDSHEAYHAVMNDDQLTESIFNATAESGFITVAWLDAGARNFYLQDVPVETPEELSGQKVRVQQSPTNVRIMELLGGSATPMGFGEVYTAIQSGVIDGAENNELALTENGHGEVVNYYSYVEYQRIPDEVIANVEFLDNLPEHERAIFDEAFQVMQTTQHEAWGIAIEEAKEVIVNKQNVEMIYPDIEPFKEKLLPLHDEMLEAYPELKETYDEIQVKIAEVNKELENEGSDQNE